MKSYQKQQAKFNMHSHVNNLVLDLSRQGNSVDFFTLCGETESTQERGLIKAWKAENQETKQKLSIVSVCDAEGFESSLETSVIGRAKIETLHNNQDTNDFETISFKMAGGRDSISKTRKLSVLRSFGFSLAPLMDDNIALQNRLTFSYESEDIRTTFKRHINHDKKEACVIFLDLCATFTSFFTFNGRFESTLKSLREQYKTVDVVFCFSDVPRAPSSANDNPHHPTFYGKKENYDLNAYASHIDDTLVEMFGGKTFFKYVYKSEGGTRCNMINFGIRIKGKKSEMNFVDHGYDDFGEEVKKAYVPCPIKKAAKLAKRQDREAEAEVKREKMETSLASLKSYRKKDGTYSIQDKTLKKRLGLCSRQLAGRKAVLTRRLK